MVNVISVDEAAVRLGAAERVLVIGCSGSGKSTLSLRIAQLCGLPYVSMDREFFWLSGWTPRPRAEALARLEERVVAARWIMDGTSPGTLPLRLASAQLLLWLRPPRWLSIYGVLTRWLRYRGRCRPEMADGCPERISRQFLSYVWNFERTESPQIEQMLVEHGGDTPVVVLRSRRDARRLVALLAQHRPVDGKKGKTGVAAE